MAKTKFSINREKLVEEQGEGYILTRVPRSNMEYYLLLKESDIVARDDKTLIAEWDSEQDINIIPRTVGEDNRMRKPTLEEAIASHQDGAGSISIKVNELYEQYYYYEKNADPKHREQQRRIRDQKRREALERFDDTKKMRENAKENSKADNAKPKKQVQEAAVNHPAEPEQPVSPAQKMERQRQEIQHYSKQQFKEILRGSRQGVDTSMYRNIHLNHQQMKELRLALKAGLDVSRYNSPFISAKHMKEIRLGARKGVRLDMQKLDHSLYNAEQMHELRLGFEKNLDVKQYLNPAYNAMQMKEIRLGMQAGLDIEKFADLYMTAEQMHKIRLDMVFEKADEILKKMFEDIRMWLSEKLGDIIETLQARYQHREIRTAEQIKDVRMEEAVEDIRELLVQSEQLPESANQNEELKEKMKSAIKEWQEYIEKYPETTPEEAAKESVKDVCKAAGVDLEQPKDNKVIDINQDREKSIEKAVEEMMQDDVQQEYAVEQNMEQEVMQEVIIEEETWEMMQ